MGTQSAAPALYPNLKYDPATSFAQVGIVNYTPQAIVSKKALTPKTLKEFIAYVKSKGAELTFGHVVEAPECAFHRMNEEHGYVDVTRAGRDFAIGDRLHIIPNHLNVHFMNLKVPAVVMSSIIVLAGLGERALGPAPRRVQRGGPYPGRVRRDGWSRARMKLPGGH